MHKTLPPSIYMHSLPLQADIAKWPGQLFQKPVLPTLFSCLPSYPLSASLAKKTLHCCVAFHQVYLPDFERKARVGVRAQPARNHFAAGLPCLAGTATAIRVDLPPFQLVQGGALAMVEPKEAYACNIATAAAAAAADQAGQTPP